MPPRVLGEGIVVVVDVGPGVRAGTSTTFYGQSKKCLINILQRKIFADKCRDEVGVVLFGTAETDNSLASGDQYQHISVLREPRLVDWQLISEVEDLTGSGNSSGDWLDALVVALDLLHDPNNARFGGKKIVLFSDFSGEFSDDQATNIISGLKNQGVDLSVIGPEIMDDDDDDDPDEAGPSNGVNGAVGKRVPQNWNGKPKNPIQLAGEALMTRIVAEAEGIICSFDEAIPQLICFEKRTSGSANWNTIMDIGPKFQIPITGRIKVRHATAPTWKKQHAHDETAVITSEVSYHRHDDHHTEVQKEEVIPAYKYGSTLVPFSDVDSDMKYQSNSVRGLSVLGFTKTSTVTHSRWAGDQVLVITAREGDEAGAVALSALIQAMVEMDMVAVTRRVYNKNANPVMGALFPDITKDYECLVWLALPFQEDVRMFSFPSLQRTTEKLTDGEKKTMDNLVNAMDLSCQDDDDDDEVLEPTGVLNPQVQHYFNVLTHRSLHPHDPIPAPAPHVLSILEPPEHVREARDTLASSLTSKFPTKKVAKKTKRDNEDLFASAENTKKKARTEDNDESLTADDLNRPLVTHVTSATPVLDFMSLLGGEAPNYNLICTQLGEVIMQLVENLQGSSGASGAAVMTKVVDCLTTFRKESCGIDPAPYNKFIVSLKDAVTTMSLRNLWDRVREGGLGLISSEENGRSSTGREEAETFLELAQEPQEAAPEPQDKDDDDMEDLLDEM